jgi:hypothetical protein
LLGLIRQVVAEHEPTFLGGVSVEVNIHKEILVNFSVLDDRFLCCPDGWMFSFTWIHVKAIQIVPFGVKAIVTA